MALKKTEWIWHNGKLIPWDQAQIHVLSHVVSYGSSVFEGIRCYETKKARRPSACANTCSAWCTPAYIYRMKSPYTVEQLSTAALDIVRENHLSSCYIRPLMIRGYGDVNVNPLPCPIETYMACWEWGAYLGAEALEQGVDVCVSSWARLAPNTLPSMAKAGANYMNSQLIRMEAIANGYAEGIALDANGYVSEGSGENIFIVRDGAIYTPPLASSVLPGITRGTIMTLCEDLGIPMREEMIPREMLYIADEVFFTGTAAEITPLRSVDRITVGAGRRGPITKRLQEEFFAILTGSKPDRHHWLTPVAAPVATAR